MHSLATTFFFFFFPPREYYFNGLHAICVPGGASTIVVTCQLGDRKAI